MISEKIEDLYEGIVELCAGIYTMITLPYDREKKKFTRKSVCSALAFYAIFFGIIISLAFFLNRKSNLEKFNDIEIDLAAAGVNKTALKKKFQKDPLSCRQQVENHLRKRFLFITPEHEKAMGKQFVEAMKKADILWENSKAQERCNKILAKFAPVMPEHFTPPEKIYILDTPEVNACCLPDGTIIVFRGLLEEFTDEEVAWVIAHELGHGTAHHSAEMISKSIIQEIGIDAFIDKGSNILKIAGTHIAAFMTNMKYSRVQENEADRLSLFYLNKANLNMQSAVTALNKFKADAGKNSVWQELLSSHPHPENRLKNVQTAIEQLQKNPDHRWGGKKDILLETAKVNAVKLYLKTSSTKKTN